MKNLNSRFVSLSREEMSHLFGGRQIPVASLAAAECSATCLDSQGYAYNITCSGGSSCSSSDFNGCSSGDDIKTCPQH